MFKTFMYKIYKMFLKKIVNMKYIYTLNNIFNIIRVPNVLIYSIILAVIMKKYIY